MVRIRRSLWLRRQRLAMFHIDKTARLLDLGCGDGLDIAILKELGFKNIIGVDISTSLIDQAKALNPSVKFVKATAEKLPFRGGSFDIVLSDSMIYHLVDKPKAFKEIKRILVKGGKLCLIEADNSRLRRFYDWLTFSPLGALSGALINRRAAYLAEKPAIIRWRSEGERFLKSLVRLGFRPEFRRTHLLSILLQYTKV